MQRYRQTVKMKTMNMQTVNTQTMNRQIMSRNQIAAFLLAAVIMIAPSAARSQDFDDEYVDEPTPSGILIGVKGGVVFTTPRRILPSLQVGDASSTTGELSSHYGKTGVGNRYGLDLIIPFSSKMAVATDVAMLTYSARYQGEPGDTTRAAVRLDVQVVQVGLGLQGNLYTNPQAFSSGGLRTIYVGGGMELGAKTIANRLEVEFKDSSVTPQKAIGSFENTDPFRNLFGLRLMAGTRFGLADNVEFVLEGSYSFALNSVFSSSVIRDNEFTIDNLVAQLGVGYRF